VSGDGDRGYIEWKPNKRTAEIREQFLTVVRSYPERGLPAPTVRDIFYDLIALYGHQKSDDLRKQLYYVARKARRAGLIEFSDITDDSEVSKSYGGYLDTAEFWTEMQSEAESFLLDFKTRQPVYLELFCEGKGKVQQLARIASKYHISVRSPGGYDSIQPKHALAMRAGRLWENTGKKTHILHMGDFDPDGLEIFEVFKEDALAFLGAHVTDDAEEVLTFDRIAVTLDQVPPGRQGTFDKTKVKEKNMRGKRWPHAYEAQLESLGVERILEIAREEVEAVLDLDLIEEDHERSKPMRRRLKETIRKHAEEAREESEEVEGEEDEETSESLANPSPPKPRHPAVLPEWLINDLAFGVEVAIDTKIRDAEELLNGRMPPEMRERFTQDARDRLARRLS
jgi:hypothetical protein